MQIITQNLVKSLFDYENGFLYWKINKGPIKAGTKAGSLRKDNRTDISINRKLYLAHRLIFLYHHGYLPIEVDHIDTLSNCIENLRPATHSQNGKNRKTPKNNTSGVKGVSWHKRSKKWVVSIGVNWKRKALGYFDDLDLAELVSIEARNKYHGEFANHG